MSELRDVVIVGSGFGGAIPALRLAEAGQDVLVLERGKRRTGKDFRQQWSTRNMGEIYSLLTDAQFELSIRYGNTLGGSCEIYSGAMIRPPSETFAYVDRTGYPLWPEGLNRAHFDPYFARVEEMMSIRRARWDEIPMPGLVFAMFFDRMGLTCDRVPFPYVDCLQCGYCETGCRFDRKRSMMWSYIPAAEDLGAEFRTECKALNIAPAPHGYRVDYLHGGGSTDSVVGRRVILAGNAVETPALLLRSLPDLPDLPEATGQYFNNNGDVAVFWELPEGRFPEFKPYKGRNNAGMMCYAFWESDKICMHTGCHPPGVFAGADFFRDEPGPLGRPWGLEHKHWLRELYTSGRYIGAAVTGLTDGEGVLTVDNTGHPKVQLDITPTMQAYQARVIGIARQVADANGLRVIRSAKNGYERGGAHLLSTCRMGDDPAHAVTDRWGQVLGYPDLYCTCSSTIPGSAGVNPAHLIAANAERIAEHLAETG